MKTTIKTAIALLLLAVLVGACAKQNQHNTTIVSGLFDVTDKYISKPDATKIITFYDFDKDKWNGGTFNFSAITKVSLNPVAYNEVGEANPLLSNEFDRNKEIEQFKKKMTEEIARVEQTECGQSNSSIYQPMVVELNRLAHSVADRKILLVYSDLMENTTLVSYYHKDLTTLIREPEKLTEKLLKIQALDDLTGITIFFIYQPQDTKGDAVYNLVAGYYTSLFESKGAKVTLTASM